MHKVENTDHPLTLCFLPQWSPLKLQQHYWWCGWTGSGPLAALVYREGSLSEKEWKIIHWPNSPVNPNPVFVSSCLNTETSPHCTTYAYTTSLVHGESHENLTSKGAKGSKGEMGSCLLSLLPLASREQGKSWKGWCSIWNESLLLISWANLCMVTHSI